MTSTMYLDHAATTPMRPEAIAAVEAAFATRNGNASGTHSVARTAKNALEGARERAAEMIGAAKPSEIVFTSGGTESDNLAIVGAALASVGRHVVVSAIEHKAVLESAAALERFDYHTSLAGCDRNGVVTVEQIEGVLRPETAVVSVMLANNEIGTYQPIRRLVESARNATSGAVFHTDAVQAFVGRAVDVSRLGVDLLTLAAHKFGGPKGVGLLFVASGTPLEPILHGGGHEAGRRSGTSNVPGVLGMVAAMEALTEDRVRLTALVSAERDDFERTLSDVRPTTVVTGREASRMPHFSHVRLPGVSAETLLIRMDQAGLFAAAGSSCQSGAIEPSHVLTATGMSPLEASECVRFTFGWDVESGDGKRAARAVIDVIEGF